jgi:hypothetical protein
MPYGSGSYGGVAYAGAAGAPPQTLGGQVDVDITLPADLMFSAPSELETWDADLSQRLNVDIRLVVGLQVPPAVVPPPAAYSNTGPTGPTGLTGPTGALP